MIYSSYIFLFGFLPVVLVGYFLLQNLKNDVWQKLFLVVASLLFYAYNNVHYVFLIAVSVLINYLVGFSLQRVQERSLLYARLLLVAGVLFNVALLGYYKYYDFFVDNFNRFFDTDLVLKNILLPLGISFFTFQQLSFIISIYKREERIGKFTDYALFVTFFPQLVAGPIVLYGEIIPQFREETRRRFNPENFAAGLYMFTIGMGKKAVIADTLALFVDNGFAMTDLGLVAGWATVLSYTLQIYFDFSGYSDMAIGLGRMFNIDIPCNFLSPYRSESVTVFWRRWHITLGRALSSYIYKPLGGNRKGLLRTCINLFLTFAVSGLWHGAAWTFVLWGALHGICVVVERLSKRTLERVPRFLRICGTFMTVCTLWVLFRADGFTQALEVYKGMINVSNLGLGQLATLAADGLVDFPTAIDCVYVYGLIAALLVVVFRCRNSVTMLGDFRASRRQCAFAGVLFAVSLLFLSRESVFIYFNF